MSTLISKELIVPEEIRYYARALALTFIIACTAGFIAGQLAPTEAGELIEQTVRELSGFTGLSDIALFALIFFHNLVIAYSMLTSGILWGIAPVAFILFNGYATGAVIAVLFPAVKASTLALGILPHGIFEIPAIILAASYGIRLGEGFSKLIRGREPFKPVWLRASDYFFRVAAPLLAIAAFLEVFASTALLNAFIAL